MKNLNNGCFYENYNEEFKDYISKIEFEFYQQNNKYANSYKKEEEILEKFPRLRQVVDEGEAVELNEKEINELIKIFNIREQRFFEAIELFFFRGMKEAFMIINNL